MLTPEYQQLALGFETIDENGETHTQYRTQLIDDNAGSLSTVLPAIRDLLRVAGFNYVVDVAVEYDTGEVKFSDDLKMKSMPKTLYVKREKDGDVTYFVADENAANLVEMGEEISIGVYTLTERKTAKGVAQFD